MGWFALKEEMRANFGERHAIAVERLRCAEELTWRGVAEAFDALFPGEVFDRSLAGNQGVGMFLCELASEMLGRTME